MGICSVDACGKPHYAKGWCNKHWQRWRAHGDPLGGGTPFGEPMRYFREVVLTYDGDQCLTWPFSRNDSGYGKLRVDGRDHRVTRLVCEHINGPAPSPLHEAAHSCGRGHGGCVAKRHLSWKTPKENQADKLIHDTHRRGERQPRSKLTERDVHEIRATKGKVSQREIAAKFGVNQTTISHIHAGRIWAWLETGPRGHLLR